MISLKSWRINWIYINDKSSLTCHITNVCTQIWFTQNTIWRLRLEFSFMSAAYSIKVILFQINLLNHWMLDLSITLYEETLTFFQMNVSSTKLQLIKSFWPDLVFKHKMSVTLFVMLAALDTLRGSFFKNIDIIHNFSFWWLSFHWADMYVLPNVKQGVNSRLLERTGSDIPASFSTRLCDSNN